MMPGNLKTLWPKYLMFKKQIEAVNIEQIEFVYDSDNKEAEFITPPILLYRNKKYIANGENKRISKAIDEKYTHVLSYKVLNNDEYKFFRKVNDITYIKDKNNEIIGDFEFIFEDQELSELATGKCKHLLIL